MTRADNSALLTRIRLFMHATGMGPSEFGRRAVKDQNLLSTLEKGRRIGQDTLLRIENFMDDDIARVQAFIDCYRGRAA